MRGTRTALTLGATALLAACGTAMSPSSPPEPSIPRAAGSQTVAGQVHEIAPDGHLLWFAAFDGSRATLHAFDTSTGRSEAIPLGATTSSGLTSHVRVSGSTVWVSDDLGFFEYDQAAGTITRVPLPPVTDLAGTVVSAFDVAADGSLVIARTKVASLQVLDATSGTTSATLGLPANYDGLTDLSLIEGLTGLPSHDRTAELGFSPVIARVAGTPSATGPSLLRGTFGPGFTLFSGTTEVVRVQPASVEWHRPDGTTRTWEVPESMETVVNPGGQTQTQAWRDPIVAGTVDGAGVLWLLEDAGHGQVRVLRWNP